MLLEEDPSLAVMKLLLLLYVCLVTRQRQTLTSAMVHTLLIATSTQYLDEYAPA